MNKRLNRKWIAWLLTIMLLAVVLPAGGAAAASNEFVLEWERTLSKDIRFIDVKQTEDGYSLIGVHNQSFDLYLAKTDAEGYLYWEKFHEANSVPGRSYNPGAGTTTPDGEYFIGGSVGLGRERNSPFYIEKFDAEGNSVEYSQYTGGTSPSFPDIRLAKDGGILYANNLGGWFTPHDRAFAGKVTVQGETIWSTKLADTFVSFGYYSDRLIELMDGSYLVDGHYGYERNQYVWRLDAEGQILGSQEYQGLLSGAALATDDGGYVIFATDAETNEVVLIKNTASDETELYLSLSFKGEVKSLEEAADGGYLVGTTEGIYKVEENGNIQWQRTLSGLIKLAPTTDGGAAVIAGQKLLKFKGANGEAPLEDGLSFDSNAYSLVAGQTLDTVVTAVYGGVKSNVSGQAVYTSDDESIVTIDEDGNLTSHRLGQTKVRAVFNNISAEATVFVVRTYTAVLLDSAEYSVNIGEPLDLIVYYQEGNKLENVTAESNFEVSDPSVARIEDGHIIGLKVGRTALKVTYNGIESAAIVDVY
ncbi:hypothetical protein YSY43_12170 [Paenibacillus sp. YSY-4.3]